MKNRWYEKQLMLQRQYHRNNQWSLSNGLFVTTDYAQRDPAKAKSNGSF